jgi:D-serine deaminase-like pyridoxal phosphate-dependent protein
MPQLGCSLDELDTPALCIDLDVLESNIAAMAAVCRKHGVDWRPHSKAHKSPDIARLEVAAGAIGVTCAKLGEAEVMAAGGIHDILIANQIVGPQKMQRLVKLCSVAKPIVAVDDWAQVQPMSEVMNANGVRPRVIIEVDIGMQRAGAAPGEATLRLAEQIMRAPGLEFAGIMGYEGHLLLLEDPKQKEQEIRDAMKLLVDQRDALVKAGMPCPIVSAGGTGSYATTVTCPGITELQAGGLIFMDAFYRHRCNVAEFDFALKLIATVVSRPTPERAIIDAGRKTHYMDSHPPLVLGRDDIRFIRLSAEHGQLELAPSAQNIRVGDRLEFVPGYSDFTTVMHNEFYGLRKGQLEVVWPLAGRGKIQ